MGSDDAERDALIDDIVGDVMGDKEKKLVEALAASYEDDPDGFVAALRKIGELTSPGDYADQVSAYIQNALVSLFGMGDYEPGCDIVRAYADLVAAGYPQGQYHWEAVASSVSIAQLAGDDATQAVVFEKLVPADDAQIEHARLAFNLACLASIRGQKADLLRFTKLALHLGKTTDQFVDDSDFDAFRDDPEFNALLQ